MCIDRIHIQSIMFDVIVISIVENVRISAFHTPSSPFSPLDFFVHRETVKIERDFAQNTSTIKPVDNQMLMVIIYNPLAS